VAPQARGRYRGDVAGGTIEPMNTSANTHRDTEVAALRHRRARNKFTELKERAGQRLVTGPRRMLIPDAELDEFWLTLEPASVDFMIGEWRGGEFDTGHRENGTLALINWFGKTFNSPSDAKPLICLDAGGNKYSNTDNGEATLWMEEFRGEVTATMVFDGQPVHDHFKKIDDRAVMGIMNGKNALDNGRYAYFYLERV
jgi:Domain of unknown function (DUF4334)/GXWXG protein